MMKRYIHSLLGGVLVALAAMLPVQSAKAQCTPTFTGSECVNSPLQFFGQSSGTGHSWNFSGEGSSTQLNPVFAFKTPGTKTVTYTVNIGGSPCTGTVTLVIKESPKIFINLIDKPVQCFENNLFCFKDSTISPNGAGLSKAQVVLSDGQLFSYTNPTTPRTLCYSIKDIRGGQFDLYYEVTDGNGCTSSDTLNQIMTIRAKIDPRFTSNRPIGCDSVCANIQNRTGLAQSEVKSVLWRWGDGTTSTNWGPNIRKCFYKPGTYNSTLIVESIYGCTDSFKFNATATVFNANVTILADKDSTCASSPNIQFSVNQIPTGATGLLWNFGNPPSGTNNFNNRTWSPAHSFVGIGPFQVKLTFNHPICGARVAYDTVLVLGPLSTIEVAFNRIPDWQVYQCPRWNMDSIQTKNFSTFYHNDKNYNDDDSTFWEVDGTLGHNFLPNQNYRQAQPEIRNRDCAVRLWNFGDNYAPKCTSDWLENKNRHVNCQYSRDSLPSHYYKSWNEIMLGDDFKMAPQQDAIFIDSNRLCKRINVYASDSMYVFVDTFLNMPLGQVDTTKNKNWRFVIFKDSTVTGPGERYTENKLSIFVAAGDTVFTRSANGGVTTRHIGPKKVVLAPRQLIIMNSKTDGFRYLRDTMYILDTMAKPLLGYYGEQGFKRVPTSKFRRTYPGVAGFDYIIDYDRWKNLYFTKIPTCNQIRLKHEDTCHVFKCEDEDIKQIALTPADARGLARDGISCLGGVNPQYGVTFILSGAKPGCTFSYAAINLDSNCNPAGFVPFTGLPAGNLPPGFPHPGYQMGGNWPSRYSMQYTASMVCNPSGCITVGLIVGNGKDRVTGQAPLCADTQWYRDFTCFPVIDPSFEIVTPLPNSVGNRKICRYDTIVVRPIGANLTRTRDMKSLRWELGTGDAGPYFSRQWRRFIQEDYFHYKPLPDSPTTRLYNFMVQTRGGADPYQVYGTNDWNDGNPYVTSVDTIITAIITKWTVVADVSKVWDQIKERVEAQGFDIYSLDGATIAKMIWNNTGIIGQPATGARGCIDTAGFGRDIVFKIVPDAGGAQIINDRDTNIRPLDQWVKVRYDRNLDKYFYDTIRRVYAFVPRWSGYHVMSLSMTSADGRCDQFQAYPVIVGFGMGIVYNDSIICGDVSLAYARPDFKYFHPNPLLFGQWDTYDYWRDTGRQRDMVMGKRNREGFTRWDWHKGDDDTMNKPTIFGGAPYGGTGVGTTINPNVQLGGGGVNAIYYKDSGVYVWRVNAKDSTGCSDTITKRLFATRLEANFGLSLTVPSCNSIIEFFDSAQLFDPCKWAVPSLPNGCDFIVEWVIDWGDGKRNNQFNRTSPTAEGLPARLAHKYTKNGEFEVTYKVKTYLGCTDSFKLKIKIPGPQPAFAFSLNDTARELTICVGDSVRMENNTKEATNSSLWIWKWGDGTFTSTRVQGALWHTYTAPGDYYIFLEQFDSLVVPPNIRKFCPATYPDTTEGVERPYIVHVKGRPGISAKVLKPEICKGEFNDFVDLSDTAYKSYVWTFVNRDLGVNNRDTNSTNLDTFRRTFSRSGRYYAILTPQFDPTAPYPRCPSAPDTVEFVVSEVEANFDIDSSGKPKFCFNRKDTNGVKFWWGFTHKQDIMATNPRGQFIQENTSNDQRVCFNYDSLGRFWVCLIAENSRGCRDTICKPLLNDYLALIKIPNVFTPGSPDGINDDFEIPITGQEYFELAIFNRWGQRVFYSENPSTRWNGTINNNGKEVPEATYYYIMKVRFRNQDKNTEIQGQIQVIR